MRQSLSRIIYIGLMLSVIVMLTGCATCDGKWFIGWGKYKNKDFELESSPPLKDIISINAVGK